MHVCAPYGGKVLVSDWIRKKNKCTHKILTNLKKKNGSWNENEEGSLLVTLISFPRQ